MPIATRHGVLVLLILLAVVALGAVFALRPLRTDDVRVSEFGRYEGYSKATFDGNRRASDYLTLPNGVRLAYDLILPTRRGVPAGEPLPVLFKYTPYLRSFTIFDRDGRDLIGDLFEMRWWERAALRVRYWISDRGSVMDPLFRTKWLARMVRHGYAVVVVERSGTGASFGVANLSHEAAATEANDILNWIAAQPWSNGRIGMYGESFQAMVQFAAASTGNPHLKAIFPASSGFDTYGVTYAGGVYNKGFQSFFTWAMAFLERVVTPVDDDRDGRELAQVLSERRGRTVAEQSTNFRNYPYRDSATPSGLQIWKGAAAVYTFVDRVNRAGVPAYMTVGWYDIFPGDAFLLYRNLSVPKRLTVRPIDHSQADESGPDLDYAAEALRWFDYWLRGIDNGIMNEAPVHYYVMGASRESAWRAASTWPPSQADATALFLHEGGSLAREPPAAAVSADAYTVDYTTTSGKKSRWRAINWTHDYPDMRANDEKGLSYTTPPLAADTEVTGHPVLHLWLVAQAPDLDAFAYLEEVDGDGRSTYVTEGNLRASHRALGHAPYDILGLPFHSHELRDVEPIAPGQPVELVFSLLPTSYKFAKGKRLRLTVTFADADNFETPVLNPAPRLRVLRDAAHASYVDLPAER